VLIKRRLPLPTWDLEFPRNGGPDGTWLMLPVITGRLARHVSHHRPFRWFPNWKPTIKQHDRLKMSAKNRLGCSLHALCLSLSFSIFVVPGTQRFYRVPDMTRGFAIKFIRRQWYYCLSYKRSPQGRLIIICTCG
jgi:hypothetical protein